MTPIVDAGPLVAAADRRNPLVRPVNEILAAEPGPFILPAPVTAEVDYLLGKHYGEAAQLAFLRDIVKGVLRVECLDTEEYRTILSLSERYRSPGSPTSRSSSSPHVLRRQGS